VKWIVREGRKVVECGQLMGSMMNQVVKVFVDAVKKAV
jgi:hypothetical protein